MEISNAENLKSLVFSFDPHPRRFLRPQSGEPKLLLTASEKIELLKLMGVDGVLLQAFDQTFAGLEAEDFVSHVLIENLKVKKIIVGPEFCFGRAAKGNLTFLRSYSEFEVLDADLELHVGKKISSSSIRELVQSSQIEKANELLDYPYFMTGMVVRGDGRAAGMGYPTANIKTERDCLPRSGVFGGVAQDLETRFFFPVVINMGVRPTFSAGFAVEAHFLNFSDSLVGRELRTFHLFKIRDEMKFSGSTELQEQIYMDIESYMNKIRGLQLFSSLEWTTKWSLSSPPAALQSFQAFKFS